MRDSDLRDLERAASSGDLPAIVAAARLLVRLERPQEALNWLELVAEDPQVRAEVEEILGDSVADPVLLTRIAAGGHRLALQLIKKNYPDLHLLREAELLEDVVGRLMRSDPDLQLAALHTAFERLARRRAKSYGAFSDSRQLAMKVLRRKRVWDQADFVGLLRWLTQVSVPESLPWSTLLTQIKKTVSAESISVPLLRALAAVERHFTRQGIHHGETIRILKRLRSMTGELGKRSDDPW